MLYSCFRCNERPFSSFEDATWTNVTSALSFHFMQFMQTYSRVRTRSVNPALPCAATEKLFFVGRMGTTKMRGLRGGRA